MKVILSGLKISSRILLLSACLLLASPPSIKAAVSLPAILSNGMVLQHNDSVKIWGWAVPGEKITIKPSWSRTVYTTLATRDGKWLLKILTSAPGGPHSMTISGGNEIMLKNLLFGEVWVCSGQSNMEYTFKMLGGWKNYPQERMELNTKNFDRVRLCKLPKRASVSPLDTITCQWTPASAGSVEDFSAVAWYFGKELSEILNMPVGLILSAWGGSPAEAWTELNYLASARELWYLLSAPHGKGKDNGKPASLFNAMIAPLLNYRIRGVAWYQGETNRNEADIYRQLFSKMIENWRAAWQQGDFPFYYVQIAPYLYGEPYPNAAFLREAQAQCQGLANTGMVSTMDVGDPWDIHPKKKKEVGHRLTLLALAKTYGRQDIAYEGPVYRKFEREGTNFRIYFDHAEGGLVCHAEKLTGFSVADSSGIFYPAFASLEGSEVVVFPGEIGRAKDVRYLFDNADSCLLFNKAGLPALPFRTDSLPFLSRKVNFNVQWNEERKFLSVGMSCLDTTVSIRFTFDGSEPDLNSDLYKKPFSFSGSISIKARAVKNNVLSSDLSMIILNHHKGVGSKITYQSPYSPQYTAGGEQGLLNSVTGSTDFSDGHWQGFLKNDLECIIDLGVVRDINLVSANFLQSTNSWIFLPDSLEVSTSADGAVYSKSYVIHHQALREREDPLIETFKAAFEAKQTRYIKLIAHNMGTCPGWHKGNGNPSWIFTDEIVIE